MSTYDKIAWLPLCGGLTGLGLVLSYLALRRRGLGSGLRGAAWSLLPLAAYLTGAVKMIWKMGVAIGDFAKGFVFSAQVWSGIAVAGLAVVLFMVSGPLRRRGRRAQDEPGRASRAVGARPGATAPGPTAPGVTAPGREIAARSGPPAVTEPARTPAKARRAKNAPDDDDDLGDVEDILRRHGIT